MISIASEARRESARHVSPGGPRFNSLRRLHLVALALLLAGCASAPRPAKAHLAMFVSPVVGNAPQTVHAVVRVAGEGDRDRWACAPYAWSWGDGSGSAHEQSECLEPAYSWTASHRYTAPGIYPIGFQAGGTVIVSSVEFR